MCLNFFGKLLNKKQGFQGDFFYEKNNYFKIFQDFYFSLQTKNLSLTRSFYHFKAEIGHIQHQKLAQRVFFNLI